MFGLVSRPGMIHFLAVVAAGVLTTRVFADDMDCEKELVCNMNCTEGCPCIE